VNELTPDQVHALARAAGLPMTSDDLGEVTHRLNALLEALEPLATLPLDGVEPTPVLPDDA
jgi:Asp-tRNA(Asn)/Glu-tRNA(Gln) amidotransferase C subunit